MSVALSVATVAAAPKSVVLLGAATIDLNWVGRDSNPDQRQKGAALPIELPTRTERSL